MRRFLLLSGVLLMLFTSGCAPLITAAGCYALVDPKYGCDKPPADQASK